MFWTNTAIDILLFFFVVDCLFMGLVIMMQRSKQEGLGAAFGGGFTESVFGAQTSQVLVKATVWAAIIFFALSLTLARLYTHLDVMEQKGSAVQQALMKSVAPVKPATPTNAAPMSPVPSTQVAPVPPPAVAPATTTTPATKPATAPATK